MSSRGYSILWCITYYVVLAIVSICDPFVFDTNSMAGNLARWALALPPAYWMINDAKLRGTFVPHVVQPLVVLLWGLIVPIYLLVTRKWWGLLYLVLHCVCGTVVSVIAYNVSLAVVWPIVFPDSGLQ